MARWGVRLARAEGCSLYILWAEPGQAHMEAADLTWNAWDGLQSEWRVLSDVLAGGVEKGVNLCKVSTRSRHRTVLSVERMLKPELILVGRHDSVKDGSMSGKLARELMDDAMSTVLVLRLGSMDAEQELMPGILVPCAGGPHSRNGIRLASRIAGRQATAFYVEPDVDVLSHEVGHAYLHGVVKRSRIKPEDISSKVVLSSDVTEAIVGELHRGDYGMLLIGAAGGGSLRRKLFGTVPERLIRVERGLCVGVIRAARPVGHRIKDKFAHILSLSVPQLGRDERIELFAEIEGKARWSFDFAVLMLLSTAIAALGLLANSAAVVIGAMLVAPLMTPLLGGGLAVVQGNWPLWRQCQKAVLLGFLCALCVGGLLGGIARWLGMGLTGELMARGEPTPLDLGVAFVSGVAASYCLARPRLTSALAGVAIAAALVPPIATTGITLALGDYGVARGAALLFGTNVVAIVLGSALNFLMAGVRGKQATPRLWAQRLVIVLALVCAGLCVPLASALVSKIPRSVPIEQDLVKVVQADGYSVVSARVIRPDGERRGRRQLEIHLEGPGFPLEEVIKKLRTVVVRRYGKDIKIRLRMTLAQDISGDADVK